MMGLKPNYTGNVAEWLQEKLVLEIEPCVPPPAPTPTRIALHSQRWSLEDQGPEGTFTQALKVLSVRSPPHPNPAAKTHVNPPLSGSKRCPSPHHTQTLTCGVRVQRVSRPTTTHPSVHACVCARAELSPPVSSRTAWTLFTSVAV